MKSSVYQCLLESNMRSSVHQKKLAETDSKFSTEWLENKKNQRKGQVKDLNLMKWCGGARTELI